MVTHDGTKGILRSRGWSTLLTGTLPGSSAALYWRKKKLCNIEAVQRRTAGRREETQSVLMIV